MPVTPLQAPPHVAPLHETGRAPAAAAPLDDADALRQFDRHFDAFDVAAKGGAGDGKVSRADLEAAAGDAGRPDLARVAQYLLDHPDLRDALDTAGEGGSTDGTISHKDLASYRLRSAPADLPLLDTRTVPGSDANPTVLDISAAPPDGASWASETGPRAGIVSVYVDGEYFADATIFSENGGRAQVNLGVLGAREDGRPHTIELRDSSAVGTGAPDAAIDPASVSAQVRELDTGSADPKVRNQALAAKYAPSLTLVDEGQATNNAPLMTTAQVIDHGDGTTTIAYRVLYSNEDGGDGSDPEVLDNRWGRTTDDERIYEVTIDADGNVIDFSGKNSGGAVLSDDDKGVREMQEARGAGGLPALSIYNEHNNVQWDDPDARHNRAFSGAPVLVTTGPDTGPDQGNEPGPPTNAVMRDHPWTWAVANAEMVREGKADAVAPYGRLYLGLDQGTFQGPARLGGLFHGPVEVEVTLRDGSTRTLPLEDVKGTSNSVSLALPFAPDQVASVRVAGVDGAQLQAYYLAPDDTPMAVSTGS